MLPYYSPKDVVRVYQWGRRKRIMHNSSSIPVQRGVFYATNWNFSNCNVCIAYPGCFLKIPESLLEFWSISSEAISGILTVSLFIGFYIFILEWRTCRGTFGDACRNGFAPTTLWEKTDLPQEHHVCGKFLNWLRHCMGPESIFLTETSGLAPRDEENHKRASVSKVIVRNTDKTQWQIIGSR